MLNEAFAALKTYDWGTDIAVLAPIDDAVAASHGKPDARADLENRLVAALKSEMPRDAKDYVCRKLAIVGSAVAVPALAPLLTEKDHAHMARFALERIPASEAGAALRDALAKTSGTLKVGVISSLGGRRDTAAVASLGPLLRDGDPAVARAAALALGAIGTLAAANVLQEAAQSATSARQAATDALLACAESLLAAKKTAQALSIYTPLADARQPRLVRLAATRGMLACAAQQS